MPYSSSAVKRAAHLRAAAEVTRAKEAACAVLRALDRSAAADDSVRGDGDRLRAGGAYVQSLVRSLAQLRAGLLSVHLSAGERPLSPPEAAAAARCATNLVADKLRVARTKGSLHASSNMAAVSAAVCKDVGVGGTLVWPAPDVKGWMRLPVNARALRLFNLGDLTRYLSSSAALSGVRLVNHNESWSTRTCASCQRIGPVVQGRWFSCTQCGFQTLRDGNGASNMAPHALVRGAQAIAATGVTRAQLGSLFPTATVAFIADAVDAVRVPAVPVAAAPPPPPPPPQPPGAVPQLPAVPPPPAKRPRRAD